MSDAATATVNLNLREGPGTSTGVRGTVHAGTEVEVLGREGDWLRVRIPGSGHEGFLAAWYVRLPGATVVTGFLRDDTGLAAIALAPAKQRIATPAAGPSQQAAARIWNAYGGLLGALAARLRVEPEAMVAVMMVESGGTGFVDGRMVIRFENHVFFDRWGKANPSVFSDHFRFAPTARWKDHAFRAALDTPWTPFHGKQSAEWTVFTFAEALDRTAARMSISMGLPQVMGFNFAALGYRSVDDMFDAFSDPGGGERAQVLGLFDFIRGAHATSAMVAALRAGDWVAFARRYNGSGQAEAYGARLKAACGAAKALAEAPGN
jgi:hypothetical protein